VAAKYGRDRVSQIITYGSMAAKAVVRDTGRVLGHPYGFVDSIAKLIPNVLGICLDDALGESEAARGNTQLINPELVQRYQQEDSVRDLLDLARELEDLVRNAGKHAGGVVIAPAPLTDFCPLFAEHDSGGGGRHPVTQFDKDDVEAIGLVKFDFLGLRTLTIIDWAVKAINARHPAAPVDIATLPLEDADTYALFSRGETVAVFQFESRGMRELLKRALPDRFEDLIALVSLFRPGPMDLIPDYIERKHGRQSVAYPEPRLKPILGPTYGVMVYQEQVMQIAQVLAGYSLGNADLLRRAMGKKDHAQMAAERARFEAGAATNGVAVRAATHIFDLMAKFAGYGFNKSHAAAYALVSYQTAWLKAHHPADFMAAVLSSDMDSTDKVVAFLDEARAMHLRVLAPDVNASTWMFEAMDACTIRYGLGAIKGVGRGACEAITAARVNGGEFTDLLDLCRRVDHGKLNKRALEALLLSGALDGMGCNRASLMAQLPEAMKAAEQLAREHAAGQVSLFGGTTIAPPLTLTLPEREEWPVAQKLSGERDTLGHYLSGHPLDPYRDEMRALIGHDLGEIEQLWERGRAVRTEQRGGRRPELTVVVAGQVVSSRRKGDAQAFAQLEDGRGRIECGFFSEAYFEHAALLARDRILVIEGGLREDEFSGGFSLRVRRAWDWHALYAQAAETLRLQVDLRVTDAWAHVEALLARHRPGPTPLHIELLQAGACGSLLLNGAHGVRVDADLIASLRAQAGVRAAAVSLSRNWRGDGV
ncbi:MAG TPA: DNA polymerase III subunit alpha, partial [Xanthomonadaceae bacterium]|nr:DNA polymerase III subunit alpha [Xanthomonadaceae bacterium]